MGSKYIFNEIKNDGDLSYPEQMATIYMIYSTHLDLAIGGSFDIGFEIFSSLTNRDDMSFPAMVLGAAASSMIQNTIGIPLFESWNQNIPWTFSPFTITLQNAFDFFLGAFGSKQMSYLFDESITMVSDITNLIAGLLNLGSHSSIISFLSEAAISHEETLIDENGLNSRELHKIILAFMLSLYHIRLTFY